MVHLNQKCFSTQIWTFIVIVSWINIHANGSLRFVQVQLAITLVWKVQFQQFKHFSIACSKLFLLVHLNQKCFSTQIWTFIVIVSWINIHANGSLRFVQVQLAITLVWKVQFQQFKHFSIACSKLFLLVHLNQKCFSTQIWTFIVIVQWINIPCKWFVVICSSSIMLELLELDLPNQSYGFFYSL